MIPTTTPPRNDNNDVDTQRVAIRPSELTTELSSTSDSNFFAGFKGGIAKGGLFLATHLNLAVGERVRVAFTLPGIELPQRVECEVAWVRTQNEQSDVPPGAGLRFITLDPEVAALIDRFMAKRPAMFYEI